MAISYLVVHIGCACSRILETCVSYGMSIRPFAYGIWKDCRIFLDTTGFINRERTPFIVRGRTKADISFYRGQIEYQGPDSAKALGIVVITEALREFLDKMVLSASLLTSDAAHKFEASS